MYFDALFLLLREVVAELWTPLKFKVFTYGERIMDRVEFEELALNGLDPSLGPSLSKLAETPGKEQKKITVCLSPMNESHLRVQIILHDLGRYHLYTQSPPAPQQLKN